jgi:hypothetical protein
MNCYIHLDKPAVATCHECGMGLCRDCVDNSAYTIDNHPLCHDCNLKQASADLADAKSKKIWSLVKFIFGSSFLLLGISIYSSTGDIMNAWIYAGIAGIPAAFRSTRDSKREQVRKGVRDALTTDMMDSVSNTFIDLLVRIAAIIILAPITAAFAAIKNLFIFISSFGKVKNAQLAYDYLSSGQDIAEDVTPVGVSDSVVPQIAPTTTSDIPQQTILESGNLSSAGVPQSPVSYIPQGASAAVMPKKTNTGLLVGIVLGVLLLAGGIMGYFLWYVPYAKDRDALRTYVLADNVFLRSSQMAGVEYNILEKIPYGSELITYNKNAEWASVKVNGIEGYMASPYLLTQADFNLLNGVWGDTDSRMCISSSKCRLAILDFYKDNQLASGSTGWQIYTKNKGQKPNTVFYPRLYDKSSKFTDFVFVTKNNASGERVVICYSFDNETETPVFRFKSAAPSEGYIKNATVSYGKIKISFDNYETVEIPLY